MASKSLITRRAFGAGSVSLLGLGVAGCADLGVTSQLLASTGESRAKELARMYGPLPNERFPIPAADISQVDPKFYRREISFRTPEPAGTIIVNTKTFYCHLVLPGNRAMRYGVGLGRAGFAWSGRAKMQWKRKWPTWTPPADMIARQPNLEKYSAANGGMPAGLDNPLGARALYIYKDGKDTLYRLHGTPDANSIGKAVSSGCVRFLNQDIVDLYDRVPNGSPIVVV